MLGISLISFNIKPTKLFLKSSYFVSNALNMPVKVKLNGNEQWLRPQTDWVILLKSPKDFKLEVDQDFYVNVEKSNDK